MRPFVLALAVLVGCQPVRQARRDPPPGSSSGPSEGLFLVGGMVVGGALGGLVGAWATRCEATPDMSCEDAGAMRFVGIFVGVGVGALVGMFTGQAIHQLATRAPPAPDPPAE